jgi:hypothetical protein
MFPYVFWDASKDMFGRVVADPAARGDAYLFYSHAHLSAGAAAEALEAEPPAEAVARVMAVIRRIHEPRGIQVPAPIQARARPSRCAARSPLAARLRESRKTPILASASKPSHLPTLLP